MKWIVTIAGVLMISIIGMRAAEKTNNQTDSTPWWRNFRKKYSSITQDFLSKDKL